MGWGPIGDIVDGAKDLAGDVVDTVKDAGSAVGDWTSDHWKDIVAVGAGIVVTAGIIAIVVASGGTAAPFVLAGAATLLGAGAAGGATTYVVGNLLKDQPITWQGLAFSAATGAALTWATPAAGTVFAPAVERVAGQTAGKVVLAVTGGTARGEASSAAAAAGSAAPDVPAGALVPDAPVRAPVPEPSLVPDPVAPHAPEPPPGGDVIPDSGVPPPPSGGRGINGRLDFEPPAAGGVAAHGSPDEAALIRALQESGTKISPENVVRAGTTPQGKVVWLETGNERAGLQHIVEGHGADFARVGIPEEQVPDFVMAAVTRGRVVGTQGAAPGRPVYEVVWNGEVKTVAVTVGNNGFVVGANPTSSFKPLP